MSEKCPQCNEPVTEKELWLHHMCTNCYRKLNFKKNLCYTCGSDKIEISSNGCKYKCKKCGSWDDTNNLIDQHQVDMRQGIPGIKLPKSGEIKLQHYLESTSIINNRFSPEQLSDAVDKMKKMAPALLKQIAKEDGYTDMNFDGCKFIDLHFSDNGLVAHYRTPFADEGEKWVGDTYVTWNGKNLSVDFGGSADKLGEDDE